jgi:ABC-type multidrug transport system fused ATPase/permease subunit
LRAAPQATASSFRGDNTARDSAADAARAASSFAEPSRLRSRDIFRLAPRVWPFIRPYKRHLLYLFLAMAPGLPAGLFTILMTRVFFDAVGHGHPLTRTEAWMLQLPITASREEILWRACVISMLVTLFFLPYGLALFAYAVWILQRVANLFRVNLYARLQELSLRFHSEESIGDAIFRMFQDSAAIPQVINGLVIQPLRWLPFATANLVWLVLFDYRMAAVAAALVPANFMLAWAFSEPMRKRFRAEREAAANATKRIEETLASIKAVKAFGRETAESDLYAHDNWQAFLAARRARMVFVAYHVCAHALCGLAYVGALYFGAEQVLGGGLSGAMRAAVSLGLFQGALAVFDVMSARTRQLTELWGSLQDVGVAIARVFEMMAKTPEERVRSGSLLPRKPRRALVFERVSFGYDGRASVLCDASLEARVGQITALMGPSGCGKSTIVALVMRFFDPLAGRILLDGRDLREFDLAGWRTTVAVAFQESPLFTASLRDNITYGRAGASPAEIARAVERAALGDFVRSLPAGLDTMLGEKGARISAGQAQRIALARALLRDAPILILDEPTAALESATEEFVMRAIRHWLDEKPGERIVLLATHRPTTARHSDRVYRISAGNVALDEDATFEPLQS